ncbi:ectonucleoside triphosphate diphosphohydrolase 6 isoform X4 [Notamacropus eugenii]|uniref:ectonucleoside triphosphate diphosphohydrolase 6 isoform X4 n=1 Tax=Notamacropus eugenii TaxID=9315 RepID=UPI003B6752A4
MRKILRNGHGNMKISKIAYPLGLFVCLFIYVAYVKWRWAFATQRIFSITETTAMGTKNQQYYEKLVTADRPVFYGIMFDAGSTGTRIHVFQFTQTAKETPILTHETFKALKPGLSAYADDVDKVREVFQASPFLVGDDCVSIMNGTDEGVSAWITVNFLTGNLNTPGKNSVGMLDLGGGSTQITFLPKIEVTLQTSPAEYITSFQMFNSTYKLYSYSYLGLGLMSARLAILGGTEGKPDKELVSPCFPSTFHGEWEHAEITYKISGHKTGVHLYELCSKRVSEILHNKVHKTEEVKNLDFYAFSYYYDLAANVGLIGSGYAVLKWNCDLNIRRKEAISQLKTLKLQQNMFVEPWKLTHKRMLLFVWTLPILVCYFKNLGFQKPKCLSWLGKLMTSKPVGLWELLFTTLIHSADNRTKSHSA